MSTGVGLVAGANKFQFKEKYDALKEAEQKQKLSQPNKKITSNEAQKKDLKELNTLLGTFKGDINSILDGDAFGKSKVETTGESASITTSAGVNISDFSIDVKKLATKDAYQTNSFSSEAFGIFSDVNIVNEKGDKEMFKSTDISITVGKEKFNININSGDSLQSINDKILNATNNDGKKLKDLVNTKVLETGKGQYRLMITSKEAGTDNQIKFGIVENEKNPNAAKFSEAVLKKLGFFQSIKESELKESLNKSEVLFKGTAEALGGNYIKTQDIKDFVSKLTGDKTLTYKDEDGVEHSFTLNKDTDLGKLSVKENEAVFKFYKDEQMKNAVTEDLKNGSITITYKKDDKDETFTINDIKDLDSLDKEQLKAVKLKYEDKEIQDFIDFVKNTKDELNITAKDDNGKEITVSINSDTDYSKLTQEQKNIIREHIYNYQEQHFTHELNIDKVKKELEEFKKVNPNHIQEASDAKIVYEGIEITKGSNNIDDLILGAKITLKKEGVTNFNVKDDTEALIEHFTTFTTNYNAIVNNLAISTKFDPKTKEAGSLQGVTEISRLKSELSSLITKTDSNGMSLSALGFELNEKGILTFKKSKFEKVYEEKPQVVKDFLQGSVKYEELSMNGGSIKEQIGLTEGDLKINGKDIVFDKAFIDKLADPDQKVTKGEYLNKLVETINNAKISGVTAKLGDDDNIIILSDGKKPLEISGSKDKLNKIGLEEKTFKTIKKEQTGIFRDFKDKLDNLSGKNGTLTKFEERLDKEKKDLQDEIKKINEEIERKFEMLASKLNSYDKILHKYDMQSQTINALINAAFANK